MRSLLPMTAAVATSDFNIHLLPPPDVTTLAPPSAAAEKCEARKCPWWPYTSSDDFKTNAVLILVILLCSLICALAFNAALRFIMRMHLNRRRNRMPENQKQCSGDAASELYAGIPALIFSEETKLKGAETECIICLSEFSVGDKIRVLEKCGHGFHFLCIRKWLLLHSSCPTCRTNCALKSDNSPP